MGDEHGARPNEAAGAWKMAVNFPGNESNVEAAALLREHVRESLKIAEQIVDTLRLQICHLEELDESARWPVAHCFIVTRIADDIEAAASLVLRGYFMQAQTLGASVYELSYTAAFIGDDDERAAKWLNWSDLDNPPWPRRKMVAAIRRALGDSSTHADGRYASLCWAKHGNPRFQRAGGYVAQKVALGPPDGALAD